MEKEIHERRGIRMGGHPLPSPYARVSEIVAFSWDFCTDEDNTPLRRKRDSPSSGKIFLFPLDDQTRDQEERPNTDKYFHPNRAKKLREGEPPPLREVTSSSSLPSCTQRGTRGCKISGTKNRTKRRGKRHRARSPAFLEKSTESCVQAANKLTSISVFYCTVDV